MLATKIELVTEQNKLIKYLYTLFTNLEPEIKRQESLKSKESNQLNKESKPQHMEYVYKDMVIKFLKESSKLEEGSEKQLSTEDKIKLQKCKDEYILKKKQNIQKLEDRCKYLSEYNDIDLDKVYSYGYVKSDKKKSGVVSTFVSCFYLFCKDWSLE